MQDFSLVEGVQRRDFMDVIWQIADKRCCDEVVVRYDCGHAIRADIWAPSLPKTREYGMQEAERRRFMQHSVFVLTKDPAAPRVQITVPEGLCRQCRRGQRQVLICGPLHMDLSEERRGRPGGAAAAVAATARRLELPLSSHTFLAAMGQVCRLPENLSPPPLVSASAIKPNDGAVSREAAHQLSRREVEDALKADLMKYVCIATVVLVLVFLECVYLLLVHFGPLASEPGSEANLASAETAANSSGLFSGFSLTDSISQISDYFDEPGSNMSLFMVAEIAITNSTWALSSMTASVHQAFGPADDYTDGGSLLWWLVLHLTWLMISMILAPILWVAEVAIAIPRFIMVHVCFAVLQHFVWRPFSWVFGLLAEIISDIVVFIFQCIFSRPSAVITHIPMTNPMVVAMALSLLVAALSAPQPPSLSLPSVWGDLPGVGLVRSFSREAAKSKLFGPMVRRILSLFSSVEKDGRQKGGVRGAPTTKGHKEKPGGDRKPDVPGKPDRPHVGKQDGRAPSSAAPDRPPAPACFVCLDRPSRYVLEPCGHRVVCGECAVQLVEAAARNRSISESSGGHHSERGGACPSCGLAITRAMRLFS